MSLRVSNGILAGTFNDKTQRRSVDECTDCPAGKFCQGEGNDYWTDDCSTGFYCIGGADNMSPNDGVTGIICPKG